MGSGWAGSSRPLVDPLGHKLLMELGQTCYFVLLSPCLGKVGRGMAFRIWTLPFSLTTIPTS